MSIEAVETIIKTIVGPDFKNDENLSQTPKRVAKSWSEIYSGYSLDPAKILATDFPSDGYDQMVISKDIEIYSMCSHHMLPFFGKAHLAYIPGERVVGLSKLARLVDCFSKRLQIQERLTQQVSNAMQEHLQPKGVMVVIEAQHMCMTMRGVGKQNSWMVTSAFKGAFEKDEVRQEFLQLIERKHS